MEKYFHSVTLDKKKCKGCINCIKRCPTEAIRVRNGKAKIIKERCIDCGECIKVCPYSAKTAKTDQFENILKFEYKIALPAPTLYGQFKTLKDVNVVLTGLLNLGFDEIFEVARGADIISDATRKLMETNRLQKPVLGTACPACLRLIKIRFPQLIPNLLPLLSPMDVVGKMAREQAMQKTGLPSEKIGIFFISPCAAKVTAVKAPLGVDSVGIDGVLSMNDIYKRLAPRISKITHVQPIAKARDLGIGWAKSGGESAALEPLEIISVDGIDNVISVLEQLENNRIDNVDFIELNACVGGCVGGPLTIENSFIAKSKIKKIQDYMNEKYEKMPLDVYSDEDVCVKKAIEYEPILKLDDDFIEAMRKMESMEKIAKDLPGLDCGSCGAPSCHALAEDIVRGFGSEGDCIFKLRERISAFDQKTMEPEEYLPPPFRTEKGEGSR